MNEYGEFIGVDNIYFALVTQDDENGYVAGAPQYLAPVAEISGEAKTDSVTTYYDNKAANNYISEAATELKITVQNVSAQKMAILLGKKYDATSGRVYDSGEANPPDIALGFRFNMGQNGYRYYWFLKGTMSGGAEEASSKADKIDVKNYELTYTAVSTRHEWTIDGESQSIKRVFADTSDPAFDPTGWFSQVQTPDKAGSPAAITLVSSTPTDGATDVSSTAPITLTFSNPIESEAVTLINSTNGNIVAVTKSLDVTKKILTITPTAALSATTKYIVSIAGVVDAYGQALAATAIDFTTAA
ncbi:major tail protein [Thermoanaerobacterium sp. R66]|uniref:major tail protein n=1 Tax=Thermoanaerobacterium sp. R66 TaxID=2742479 RepID=UPI00238095AC|nr:major tail protein [Thermoanaerobacterium sp. R66]MDE4542260.1 Ig-like domain-containing protein [Thermoanaerobacterium sp. R66]